MLSFSSKSSRCSQFKFSSFILSSLFLLISLPLLTSTLSAQSKEDIPALELGKPIERELSGDAAHSYTISLAANQFLHVVVEQKGIDVVIALFSPDGKKLVEVDSPNGTQGPEPVSFIAEVAGSYRFEVRSLDPAAAAGRYQVKIDELRAAKALDTTRVAAERAFTQATILFAEGTAESLQKSIKKYEEALPLQRTLGDRNGEMLTLSTLGRAHDSLRDRQKALVYYEQALVIERALGDRGAEAAELNNIGLAYDSLGEKQKALSYYNQALPIWRAVGDRSGEATTLGNLGAVYETLGEMKKALDYYSQALPLARAAGDRNGEAVTLNNMGLVYDRLGDRKKALDLYNQALPLRREIGDRLGEGDTLNNIGMVNDSLGEEQKALEYYEQALKLYREVGDRGREGVTLNNVGVVFNSLGEKKKALEYHNQALLLNRAAGDRSGEAYALISIGALYGSMGEKQLELDNYNQVLPLLRSVGDRRGEAMTLTNIGTVYDSLGEWKKALDFYSQALPIRRAVGDREGEAFTLNSIGEAYSRLEEKQKALDFFNQALPLRRAVGDRRGEGVTLNSMGLLYSSIGEHQKALDHFNQALRLGEAVSDRRGQGSTFNNVGNVYIALRELQKAFDYYNQALPINRAVGDREGEGYTLANLAMVERERGNLTEARSHMEAALTIFESLRTKIASKELRSSYFATVQKFYDFYIDLLMRLHKQQPSAGHDGRALQASERGRARSLLETLAEAGADIRQGVDPKLVERERLLQEQLNAKAEAQTKLLNGPHTEAQAEILAKDIGTLTIEYQKIEAEIRQKSPNYAALTQPVPLTLKEIQTQLLDQDTLLLEYSLGLQHSYLWAVTPTSITSYELPNRDEIQMLARQVYAFLTDAKQWKNGDVASRDVVNRLSQMLLGPVASQLGKKRLLIVADGALQYIPFGALPAPSEQGSGGRGRGSVKESSSRPQSPGPRPPLIVDHEIVSLPSASTLAVLRQQVKDRKPAAKAVAVLADPVFESNDVRIAQNTKAEVSVAPDKPTLSTKRELPLGLERSASESGLREAVSKIPRLPGTRVEARQILALVPPSQSKEAFDFSANRQTAMSDELSQYRYVHFATHGFLNSVHPELSGLVFSMVDEKGQPQDGFLRAHEIFNLKLPAELVVLSACQTGLGKEIKGEGLVGLTRGFMYAGAPRVVVSLWSVSDQATAELMTRFYRGMLKNGLRPAAALRAAQVSLMKEKKWESPFYWAAFTLQGEWK